MNPPLKAALVALLGLSASLGASQAQTTTSYSPGDLLLGFRASDGIGATKNYVVNLGSAETLSSLSSPKLFSTDGAIATDLVSLFGADWSNRSDIHWSVSGTTGSFAPVGSIPAKTLFVTLPESTPGTYGTNLWMRASDSAQGIVTSRMNGFANAYKSYTPSTNNPLGVIQNQTDANSYGSFQKGGTLPNSGPAPGISFGYFNPSIEANFAAGPSNSVLDLVKLEPASESSVGAQGTLMGRIRINASGILSFTPAGASELPPIVRQPQATGINQGGSALLSVSTSFTEGVTYQWSKDGTTIAGATNAQYLATAPGSYSVTLTNFFGSVTSQDAVVTTSELGQLYLGFRASDGTGATKNYVVKLGSASNFSNGSSIRAFGTDGSIAKDLSDLFGSDWSTRGDVFWSVFGTTGSFDSVGGLAAKTLFASIAETTPGTFESSRVWVRTSDTAQGVVTTRMNGFANAYKSYTPSTNNPLGVIQNQTDANSYGSFQKGGTLPNSGPAPGISFGHFNPSIEASFASGASSSILNLIQLEPASEGVDPTGVNLGRFRITSNGLVTFSPTTAVEVPPAITTQPLSSTSFPAGGSTMLTVQITDASLASYQWSKNGSAIVGETSASLAVSTPGSYTVTVTNPFGSVTSSASRVMASGNGISADPTASIAGNVKGSVALAGAEIPAFDPVSKHAFASSSSGVQVVDLSNPANPTFLTTIAPASLGVSGLTSNDVSSINVRKGSGADPSVLAIAVINSPKSNPGHVVFVRADNGTLLGSVQVGVVPDHVTFTPDGKKVLVANEGELDGTAATIPDSAAGSVSIIDVSSGFSAPNVTTAGFAAWDNESSIAQLRASGVRIFENGLPSKDFEPEYIGVTADSSKAFVTLQEANAIGILDIVAGAFTDVIALGKKDFSTGYHDFSDKDGTSGANLINLTTGNPVKGLYMPDGVASFSSQGQTYYIIANEGDDRNDFITPDETTTVSSSSYVLDPTAFPNATSLKQTSALGRLVVSNATGLRGDIDGDGDVDEILSYGARSFSILDAQGNMLFDSGDLIERIVSTKYASSFDDGRSDNKGPEPEGVTVAELAGVPYAFVGLERSSLVLVFDVSNPLAPVFVNGIRRSGDTSPEGLMVVPESEAPEGKPLLLVTNEVSNTLSVFELGAGSVSIGDASLAEGDSGTKVLNLEVTRSGNASAFSVGYSVSGGTATADADYSLASGTLTFTVGGSDTQNIAIIVKGDTSFESDETIVVTLSNLVNVTGQSAITRAMGTATITNDDALPPPAITVQPTVTNDGKIAIGGKATLSVTASGTDLSYQWKKDGQTIAGATSASYEATASGSYTVEVSNSAGSVTSSAITIRAEVALSSLSGEYQGLLVPEDASQLAHHGILVATVAKPVGKTPTTVAISGKIQRASATLAFTGKVDAYGKVTFGKTNLPSLSITGLTGTALALEIVSASGRTLEGKVTSGSAKIAAVSALPVITPAGTQLGSHTALFQQVPDQAAVYPDGDGYATMAVTARGVAIAGKLADGSTVSAALKLTSNTTAPLFLPLYKGKGLLSGGIRFDATQAESDAACIGMRWMRASALTTPAGYVAGWPSGITVDFVASKYDKTKGFGLTNTAPSGLSLKFAASGGNLPSTLEGSPNLSIKNVLSVLKTTPNGIKLAPRFTATIGAIAGSFTATGDTKATTFAGVVLQKGNYASGFFLRGTKADTKSGLIQITE